MVDIIHRVGIKAPISKVYAAVSTVEGVAGWWSKDTVGKIRIRQHGPGQIPLRERRAHRRGDVRVHRAAPAQGSPLAHQVRAGGKPL